MSLQKFNPKIIKSENNIFKNIISFSGVHSRTIWWVTYVPHIDRVATLGSHDIKILNFRTGDVDVMFGRKSSIQYQVINFRLNEKPHLISCCFDGTISLWNVVNKNRVDLDYCFTRSSNNNIYSLLKINDNVFLSGDNSGRICVYDYEKKTETHLFTCETKKIWCMLKMKSDPTKFFSAGGKGKRNNITLWDLEKRILIRKYSYHRQCVRGIQSFICRKTGEECLVSGGEDFDIVIWNIGTGAILKKIQDSSNRAVIWHLCIYGDGNLIVGDQTGRVRVYEIDSVSGSESKILAYQKIHGDYVNCFTMMKDRQFFSTASDYSCAYFELPTLVNYSKKFSDEDLKERTIYLQDEYIDEDGNDLLKLILNNSTSCIYYRVFFC